MWKVRASLITGADWSNAPPVPLARCSTLSTFPKTIFIHCTLSRHSSGTVMSVSSFSSAKIPYKSTRIRFEQAQKNCPGRIDKLEFTYTSGERWCLNPHRLRRLLVFLLARNKDRPTQLVFFLHPPLLVDCIEGTGLNDSVAPPFCRLTYFPHYAQRRLRYSGGWKGEKPVWGMGDWLWKRQQEWV